MMLEDRYIVLKRKDLLRMPKHLMKALEEIVHRAAFERQERGVPPLWCLCIEDDWPEFQPFTRALKERIEREAQHAGVMNFGGGHGKREARGAQHAETVLDLHDVAECTFSAPEPVKAMRKPIAAPVKHSHYKKDIRHLSMLDIYRFLKLFNVTDPAIQHAIKKLALNGERGAKDIERDYREAIDSIERALQMIAEDAALPQHARDNLKGLFPGGLT